MKLIQIYDPPMCCSTGVCGPDVDPKVVQFAADVKWLADQGATIERFNLAQTPIAFAENEVVRAALTEKGEAALPLILVDGKVAASGTYPTREELPGLLGSSAVTPSLFTPAVAELIAIGAAIAANCDPCLRYHEGEAKKLGVSASDVGRAVDLAAKVKDAPHRNIMRLAARLTQTEPGAVAASATSADGAAASGNAAKGSCCS
jgi:AhpD family alkylhydroperoxidase